MILFLSEYPLIKEKLRDGFFQRVINIDSFFYEDERTYLMISPFKNFKQKKLKQEKITILQCNFFIHFFLIIKLFKQAELVYIQSLFNTLYSFIFIKIVKNKYALDLHGVVPEELELNGKKIHKFVFITIERIIYNKLDFIISVTNKLAHHYKNKYPNYKAKYIIYAIFPNNLQECQLNQLIDDSQINIIYSGNTQTWQNIDLMLEIIKENLYENFRFIILTGELLIMKEMLYKHGLQDNKQILLDSVAPNELKKYYNKSHYGFILRNDIIVNNVACPTKLIEYMNFGIIPIVLSDNIGDFKELGYERINYKDLNENLNPLKSTKNIEIIKRITEMNRIDLKSEMSE